MNVISKIRKSLNEGYDYLINAQTYDQLQREWITRAKMEGWIEVSKIEELKAEYKRKLDYCVEGDFLFAPEYKNKIAALQKLIDNNNG